MQRLPTTRTGKFTLSVLLAILAAIPGCFLYFTDMPGSSHAVSLGPLTPEQREARVRMRGHIEVLSREIHTHGPGRQALLERAGESIGDAWRELGFVVDEQRYEVDGVSVSNLEVEIEGSEKPNEILIVGAHYDTVHGLPGADDNASGVAALLELSRAYSPACGTRVPERTLRFVAFTLEEAPHFQTTSMGSLVYARRSRARAEQIVGMLSLETIAYFSDEPGSQRYPWPLQHFYGDRGDFIAVVGGAASRSLVRRVVGSLRESAEIPSEGIAAPLSFASIGWSDHWSFAQQGYPALMVTDTAYLRNPHYHSSLDTLETLDLGRMTRVVTGLGSVLRDLDRAERD